MGVGIDSVVVAVVPITVGRFLSLTLVTVSFGEEELARGEVFPNSLPFDYRIGTVALSVPERHSDRGRVRSGGEPTSGLDVASRVMLHELIRELQDNGTTILLATHDMAEASELATRVAILLRGRITAIGTPMELAATGAGLTRISVRTEGDCLSMPDAVFPAVQQTQSREEYVIYFSTDVGLTVSALISFINAKADSLIDLRVERPSLEDRFLEITREGGSR